MKKNYCIIRMSHAGDIIHAIPFARILKMIEPQSTITWILEKKFESIVKCEPSIDRIISFDRKNLSFKKIYKFISKSRSHKFDTVFDLQGLFKSAILSFFLNSKQKIGFKRMSKEKSHLFYNKHLELPEKTEDKTHVIKIYLRLLELHFDIPFEKLSNMLTADIVKPVCCQSGKTKVKTKYPELKNEKFLNILFIPFSGWENKSLPVNISEQFIDLIAINNKYRVWIYCFGDKEVKTAKILKNNRNGISLFKNPDFDEIVPFLKLMNISIGVDTGILHLSSQSGIPTIGIYGPTSNLRNGPFNHLNNTIYSKLECSPCWKRSCKNNICLKNVKAEEIFNKMEDLIKTDYGI